ncbi:WD domain, G-beta repeat-containing protein [Toxoplasma gondii MAS]|uniref:WD domain, G-beta repeat-containing protein n=2 Tax=Toxoplasma gondii TaxID=5811 RepID=A0A086PNG2_TOXGO|nr:WD domain, G-beta repeat-containing protein [Toxoplasma gondii MAS]PUA89136.1 WD domain, G-beta repeat-containing protein [Toxoplasma gondii TgCATBr9]
MDSGDEAANAAVSPQSARHGFWQSPRRKGKISFGWKPVLRLGGRESLAALRSKLLSRRDEGGQACTATGDSSEDAEKEELPVASDTSSRLSRLPSSISPGTDSAVPRSAIPVLHRRRRGDASCTPSAAALCPGKPGSPASEVVASRFYTPPWWAKAPDAVRCRFSPSGTLLAACTSVGALRVYEVETGAMVCEYANAHVKGINDIAWHPSSAYIYTASSDGSASLFPLHFRLRQSSVASSSLRSSPAAITTFRVPFCEASGHPRCLAGPPGKPEKKAALQASPSAATPLSAAPVTSVAVPQDGSSSGCLYTGGYDEMLRLWDLRLPTQPLRQVKAHDSPVTSLDFAPASPLLLPPFVSPRDADCAALGSVSACPGVVASAGLDGLVRLWEASSLRLLRTLKGGSSGAPGETQGQKEGEGGSSGTRRGIACTHAVWSRSGKFLLCAYEGGQGGRILRLSRVLSRTADPSFSRREGRRRSRPETEKEEGKERRQDGNGRPFTETEDGGWRDELSGSSDEEEDAWWGSAVTMPLDMPVAGTAAWSREQDEAQLATAEALLRFSRPPSACGFSNNEGRKRPQQPVENGASSRGGWQGRQSVRRNSSCLVQGTESPSGRKDDACATAAVDACSETEVDRVGFSPFCTPRRWVSPFGAIWRDKALLPCGDGRVWVFEAMSGRVVEKLAAPVDFSCACSGRGGQLCAGGSVCTSVDAHPDWSLGVLATSWSAPDGGVVLWMWTTEEDALGEDEEQAEAV